jgi:putative protein kinase ArgK-like GTPase of G3E family
LSGDDHHYLTPTYQTNLMLALGDIIRALNKGDLISAFDCCETLYDTATEEVEKEVNEKIRDEISTKIANAVNGINAMDMHVRRTVQSNDIARIKRSYAHAYYRALKESLDKHSYLENAPAKPRNPQPTTVGE